MGVRTYPTPFSGACRVRRSCFPIGEQGWLTGRQRCFFKCASAGLALVDVPGAQHRDFVDFLSLHGEPAEVELLAELDPELVGLSPADRALHGSDADDVDRQGRSR